MGKSEILESLKYFLINYGNKYHLEKLGLFGSAARDEINDSSDIDIVVVMEPADFSSFMNLKYDLENRFSRQVDIIRYRDRMNPFLKKTIDREAIYV